MHYLIYGPRNCGKTKLLKELIKKEIEEKKRVALYSITTRSSDIRNLPISLTILNHIKQIRGILFDTVFIDDYDLLEFEKQKVLFEMRNRTRFILTTSVNLIKFKEFEQIPQLKREFTISDCQYINMGDNLSILSLVENLNNNGISLRKQI